MTWEAVPLGELALLNPRSESSTEPGTFLGMADVSENGTTSAGIRVVPGDLKSGYTPFRDRDILVAKITPCFENGKIAQAELPTKVGWGSTEFHVVRPDEKVLHDRYALHYLRTSQVRANGTIRMTGSAGQRRVPLSFLQSLEIPVPPLPEQRRIAAILDAADALRTRARGAIGLRSNLVTEEFLRRFASRSLPYVPVADLASATPGAIRTGPFGSDLLHSEFVDEGIPVLGIDNVVTNEFTWAKPRHITDSKYEALRRFTVQPGDVLISIMGTVGRCAVAPDDIGVAINTKHLCCISLDRTQCEPRFLQSYFLHHPVARDYLRRASKGAIMDGLNMGIIKALPVALPPIEDQHDYLEWTASATSLQHDARAVQLDTLFASLQHRAFRGEL